MVVVRGGGQQTAKMKERESDSSSAGAPVPEMARSTEPHIQTGELFPRVHPQQQEYHDGKPRRLWNTFATVEAKRVLDEWAQRSGDQPVVEVKFSPSITVMKESKYW